MSRRSSQQGLTLVEVMVASVILSLIMLATVTALRTFATTYERLQEVTDRTAEMREVSRFLRIALRDALNDTPTFVGEQDSLEWATPLDRVGSAGGIQYLRLTRQGDALLLSFAPFDPARVSEADPAWAAVVEDFVLVDAVDKVAFSYRLSPLADWTSRFDPQSSPTIPWAVSVMITADGREWPPIVVALQASTAQ